MPRGKTMQLQRWQYEALNVLIAVMRDTERPGATRAAAADKILDRVLGEAPPHIDITALRHTEIVYRSAEEIRKALNG